MTLPFSALAFDLDGTFLRSDHSYDQERFARVLKQLTARGVRVAVASGDPAQIITRLFAPFLDQLTIVAENGAHVLEKGTTTLTTPLDRELATAVVKYLTSELGIDPVLAGQRQGYFPPQADAAFLDHMTFYYPDHQVLDSYLPLPEDNFFQLSFLVDDAAVPALQEDLTAKFSDRLVITPSGNGSMDLTTPGINKGWALKQLLAKWGQTGDDLIAFGDGGNDESMLKLAAYSYAMPNAMPAVKEWTKFEALVDNDHDGVLATLEAYLSNEKEG